VDQWYCARTKISVAWEVTIAQLARQNFRAYLPIVRTQSYQLGKRIIVEQPLFGAYLFISFDIDVQAWRGINSTIGIVHLLPERLELPLPLPLGFIDALQNRKVTVAAVEEIATRYARDETVKVLTGAFESRFAKVLSSTRNATRVRVTAFEREVVATIPTADLAPAAGIRI
jgi:transcription antitermination factor NusG